MTNSAKEVCAHCGQTVNWRRITLYKGMVRALIRAYKWCKETGEHEFTRAEMRKILLGDENDTARWGDWILFGHGMVYKPGGKGTWGLHMERVEQFLAGKRRIPIRIRKRGKEMITEKKGTIKDIKNLYELLDEDLRFLVTYYSEANLDMFEGVDAGGS